MLADIGVGDDGHALALTQHRRDALAGLIDQARSDHHLIGAIAQAHGDGAVHEACFSRWALSALMTWSTVT